MKPLRLLQARGQTVALLFTAFLVAFAGGCTNLGERSVFTNRYANPELTDEQRFEQIEAYRRLELQQRLRSASHVRIDGNDIKAPPTQATDTARFYTFDVWFNADLVGGDAFQALRDRRITVDVAGAKATLERVVYGDGEAAIDSRNLIRVKVNYVDDLASFNIIAYVNDKMEDFESRRYQRYEEEKTAKCGTDKCETDDAKCRNGECETKLSQILFEPNPYLDVKRIRVFNGDLTTRIYMLSAPEVENAFGKAFAKTFYVGKAYFRNEQSDKGLIIHTTSLRARTLFQRRPVAGEKYEPKEPIYGNHDFEVQRYARPKRSETRCVKEVVSRTSTLAPGRTAPDVSTCVSPDRRTDPSRPDDTAELGYRLHQLAERLWKAKPAAASEARKELVTRAPALVAESERLAIAKAAQRAREQKLPADVITRIEQSRLDATKEQRVIAQLRSGIRNMSNAEVEALSISDGNGAQHSEALQRALEAPATEAAAAVNNVASSAQGARVAVISNTGISDIARTAVASAVRVWNDSYSSTLDEIIAESTNASPLSIDLRRRVGLTGKIATTSEDIVEQWELATQGYVWEDYYRPMTFESVLLSLSAETRDQTSQKVLRVMESLGVIAAGFVGLTNISKGFGRPDYAERVAFTTGVFIPEARKLLGKDLATYLSNLATNALPSILKLEPRQSRDGYVFFPRGPIFGYGVDEFSIEQPSYIINIDNVDVAVEGEIIEDAKNFDSGYAGAKDQVDEGKKIISDALADQRALEEKLKANRAGFALEDACRLLSEGHKDKAIGRLRQYTDAGGASAAVATVQERIDASLDCMGNALPAAPADAVPAGDGSNSTTQR